MHNTYIWMHRTDNGTRLIYNFFCCLSFYLFICFFCGGGACLSFLAFLPTFRIISSFFPVSGIVSLPFLRMRSILLVHESLSNEHLKIALFYKFKGLTCIGEDKAKDQSQIVRDSLFENISSSLSNLC